MSDKIETVGQIVKPGPSHKLTPDFARLRRPKTGKAEVVIVALLSGRKLNDIAKDLGMSANTLRDWRRAEWFREQYDDAKKQLLDGTINKLRSAGNDAVDLLHEVVRNKKMATTPRVNAARSLLEVLLRAVETQDIVARLERLETQVTEDE